MSRNIKTLQDSLNFFKLDHHLKNLECSLQAVRRNEKSLKDHMECLNIADKEMQKLSLNYHPDKIKNLGGSEEDQLVAEELQTALNLTRNLLSVLTEEILDELHIYHKYEFFTDLQLNCLGNDDQIRKRMTDVSYTIRIYSEIQQENIVVQIRKFLNSSRLCLENYYNGELDTFKKNHNLALLHLRKCTEGHRMLQDEILNIGKKCESGNFASMRLSMQNIVKKSFTQLRILQTLGNEGSLHSTMSVFRNYRLIEEYSVLPFAYYINILSMCSVVLSEKSKKLNRYCQLNLRPTRYLSNLMAPYAGIDISIQENDDEAVKLLKEAYYFASYVNDNKMFKQEVREILKKEYGEIGISTGLGIQKFNTILVRMADFLKERFNTDFYTIHRARDNLMEKLAAKKAKDASEYTEFANKFSKDLENLRQENRKKKEEFKKFVEENEEFTKKLTNRYSMFLNEAAGNCSNEKIINPS